MYFGKVFDGVIRPGATEFVLRTEKQWDADAEAMLIAAMSKSKLTPVQEYQVAKQEAHAVASPDTSAPESEEAKTNKKKSIAVAWDEEKRAQILMWKLDVVDTLVEFMRSRRQDNAMLPLLSNHSFVKALKKWHCTLCEENGL